MKIFKRLIMGLFCLAFCFIFVGCSSNIASLPPTASVSSEQSKDNFLGFAIYTDIISNNSDNQNIKNITENSLTLSIDNKLSTNNRFINLIYSKNNYDNNDDICSNTTFKSSLNQNAKTWDLELEIFLETKQIYVFEIIITNDKLSLNLVLTTKFINNIASLKCTNLSNTTKSLFNEITITFVTDLTTQNNYKKI